MIKQFAPCVKKYWWAALLSPLTVIIEVLLEVRIPMLMSQIVDTGITNQDLQYVVNMGVQMVAFALCSLAAGALSAAHGGDGGEAGQTDEAVQVLGRVNGAARQGEQRHKDEAEDQPDDAAADAGLQSRVGVDGRSGRLDRLVNDLNLRVAQNGGRRSGVDLDGGQQRVIDGLRVAARCRQREQGGIRHRAGRQADGSKLIAQLLLEQQLHAIALQDIGERG